jgi:hypothetical protein
MVGTVIGEHESISLSRLPNQWRVELPGGFVVFSPDECGHALVLAPEEVQIEVLRRPAEESPGLPFQI